MGYRGFEYGFFQGIAHELSGKGKFRLVLQPVMALLLGFRLGVADAKEGKAPFIKRLCFEKDGRWALFKLSLADAVLPLGLAVVMDSIFQYLTLRYVRPLPALVVGAILVWIPFVISRALTNRAVTHMRHRPVERTS